MTESNIDITQTLIRPKDIRQRIGSIFPDAGVLDIQFRFVSISQTISDITGYSCSELAGKPISFFFNSLDFVNRIKELLLPGYFEEQTVEVKCKNGSIVNFKISAFYLGLITDINGLIIFKFKSQEESHHIKKELASKTKELDDFIYTSAHALRGPLATLKGLIHLAGFTPNLDEKAFLIKQMDVFAEKLDGKLHHLIYFAESDKMYVAANEEYSVQTVVEALSECIGEASIDFPVRFSSRSNDQAQLIEQGELVLAASKNIVLFFCQQLKAAENHLLFDTHLSTCATEIMIRTNGFQLTDAMIEKIKDVNFGYSEILKFPELVNYYAAKKIMIALNGTVQFMHIENNEMVVLMTIPRISRLPLF